MSWKGFKWFAAPLLVASLVVTACGGATTGSGKSGSSGGSGEKVIRIGAAISEQGKLAKEGKLTKDGYDFWADWVNSHGGIKVNGQSYKVQITYYDDESKADTAAKLVDKLVNEDKIKLILGPYGSPATLAASTVSEKGGAIMIATEGAATGLFTRGYKYLFGPLPFGSDYMNGVVEMFKTLKPGAKVAVIYTDDNFSADVGKGVTEYAKQQGFDVVYSDKFPLGASDISTLLSQIKAKNPDIILESGHLAESILLVKTAKQLNLNAAMAATVGPVTPDYVKALGKDAEYQFGSAPWVPQLNFDDPIFGNTEKFVTDFKKKFGYEPDYHVSSAVNGAEILQLAIEKAQSLDTDKIREAIASMSFNTQYGSFKFDATGHEVGIHTAAIQIQNGAAVPVWPDKYVKNAKYPVPAWDKR